MPSPARGEGTNCEHRNPVVSAFRLWFSHRLQLYKRILRASSNTRVRILDACGAMVTAGWCPTPARRSGVGTVRPACCCGHRVPTVGRGAAATPRAVESPGRYVGSAGGRAGQPRDRSSRPPSARHTKKRSCPKTSSRCARRSSPPRSRRAAARAGPTPPSSPTRRETPAAPCPTGERGTSLGRRGRGRRTAAHPGFAASWAQLRIVTASIPLLVNRCALSASFNRRAAARDRRPR